MEQNQKGSLQKIGRSCVDLSIYNLRFEDISHRTFFTSSCDRQKLKKIFKILIWNHFKQFAYKIYSNRISIWYARPVKVTIFSFSQKAYEKSKTLRNFFKNQNQCKLSTAWLLGKNWIFKDFSHIIGIFLLNPNCFLNRIVHEIKKYFL